MNILKIIGRKNELFIDDINLYDQFLIDYLSQKRVLIIGAAGTIGHALAKEVFSRSPKCLHLVDISENNLVEVVRDIRSDDGYVVEDFKTFVCDVGSLDFEFLIQMHGPYDLVYNFSALKHVRSEKDIFSLKRMINTNIINSLKINELCMQMNTKKYFCVSTDKAANPVNMMGASKLIMEKLLLSSSNYENISFARFANVAFSDGSLLHGFKQRVFNKQPISAPSDIKRYFISPKEAGTLCLFASIYGQNGDIYIPSDNCKLELTSFTSIAERFLKSLNYVPHICNSENEARNYFRETRKKETWPCYFFESDTTGEKPYEEFYTSNEILNKDEFKDLWVIKKDKEKKLFSEDFMFEFNRITKILNNDKEPFIKLFQSVLPDFIHEDTKKYLDDRM
jgi:FlaA1/EpsC-like NDP-sugar epimerase